VDAIKTFHTGVSEDFLLKEEKFKDLRNRLLKSASDFYEKLSALLGKEADVDSRRALAQSKFELATLTEKVGHKEDALAAHRSVLTAREALDSELGDSASRIDLGRSTTAVASLLWWNGNADEALATCRRSESLLAVLANSDPAARAELANCRRQLARLLRHEGKFTQALEACGRARDDQEVLAGLPGASDRAYHELAQTIEQMGYLLWVSGRWDEAVPELRSAVAAYQKLAVEHPDVVEFQHGLKTNHFYLGNVLPLTGRTMEGEAEFSLSLEMGERLANANPAVTRIRRGQILGRNYFSELLMQVGKPDEAEAECRKALALGKELMDDDPSIPDFGNILADCRTNLGILLFAGGQEGEC
jgi:tetratricopeptide (TPR) repeat protein